MKHLRANTLKDHCNFLLHFGLTAGVAAGAFATLGFPPIIGAIAIGVTAATKFALTPKVKRAFQEAIDEEKDNGLGTRKLDVDAMAEDMFRGRRRFNLDDYTIHKPSLTPKIQKWVDGFAHKLGMGTVPQAAVLDRNPMMFDRVDGEKRTLKDALRVMLRDKFNQTANAFAFKNTHGNVVLNAPIVESLSARELRNVVGHEMGHLAAQHTAKREGMAWLSTPAKLLTTLNTLVTAFSSFKNAGYYFLGGAIGDFATGFVASRLGWSAEDPKDVPKIKGLKSAFNTAAIAGLGAIGGAPDLVLAVGLNLATHTAIDLIGKSYSRRNEFQADRVAAQLTGDPQGMKSALKTIGELHKKRDPFGFIVEEPKGGILTMLFDKIHDLQKSHPSVERRYARLDKMQQRAEFIYA